MLHFLFYKLENMVGKGENTGYQHFLLLPQCFQKAFSSGLGHQRSLLCDNQSVNKIYVHTHIQRKS